MNMPLEKQVSSLEPSKHLKELGVKQESHFYWNRPTNLAPHQIVSGTFTWKTDDEDGRVSAFTVAELGEMLPERTEAGGLIRWTQIHRNADGSWTVKLMENDVAAGKEQ